MNCCWYGLHIFLEALQAVGFFEHICALIFLQEADHEIIAWRTRNGYHIIRCLTWKKMLFIVRSRRQPTATTWGSLPQCLQWCRPYPLQAFRTQEILQEYSHQEGYSESAPRGCIHRTCHKHSITCSLR